MKRNLLATAVGILVALLILYVGLCFQLRFTSFGGAVLGVGKNAPARMYNFDQTMDILKRAVFVRNWLIGPIAAFVAAGVARLISGRSDWARSIVVILPIAAMNGLWASGLAGLGVSVIYAFVAYASMKAVDLVRPTALQRE